MGLIYTIIAMEFLQDWPLLLTSFICFLISFRLLFPQTTPGKNILIIIIVELAEHIFVPLLLILILILFNNAMSGILFNLVIVLFMILYLGKIVLKINSRNEFIRLIILAVIFYFFMFFYPPFLIYLQFNYLQFHNAGWLIIILTNIVFITAYIIYKIKKKKIK